MSKRGQGKYSSIPSFLSQIRDHPEDFVIHRKVVKVETGTGLQGRRTGAHVLKQLPQFNATTERWSKVLGLNGGGSQVGERGGFSTIVGSTSAARIRVPAKVYERSRASFLTATSASVYSEHGPEPVGIAYGGEDYEIREEDEGLVSDAERARKYLDQI